LPAAFPSTGPNRGKRRGCPFGLDQFAGSDVTGLRQPAPGRSRHPLIAVPLIRRAGTTIPSTTISGTTT
jgi:hypothetical protein